jgi:peroxiredoxin
MKHTLFAFIALAILAASGWLWLRPAGPVASPDITLVGIDGAPLALADYRGKPLLVSFWATTCNRCIEELPQLIALYEELAPQGLEIIGIAMHYDPPNLVLAMRDARRIPWPVALDIHAAAAHAFGNVQLTPTKFLIAPDGRIVSRKTGATDMQRLRADIISLLQQATTGNDCRRERESRPVCSG